jgi:hypothetical protein
MNPRTTIAATALLAAAVGYAAGAVVSGGGTFLGLFASRASSDGAAPSPAAGESASREGSPAPAATLSGDAAGAAAAAREKRLQDEVESLRARVADLEREAGQGTKATTGKTGTGPEFTFGEMGRLEAVREADWPEMATASKVVADAILEVQRMAEEGKPADKGVYMRLQENVERIRKYEYRTIDKIPTAAPHNGELTHPISVTNLLSAVLSQAGVPLSAAQKSEFERLGTSFDADFVRMRQGWGPDVPRVRRILAEFRRKKEFTDAIYGLLTPEQRAAWVDPARRAVAGIDLFDPTLMVIHSSTVLSEANAADLRRDLLAAVRTQVGVAGDAPAPRVEAAVDAYLARTTRTLSPVPKVRAKRYTADEALVAGEATADLVDSLLRDSEATPAARTALLDDPTWYVLRLIQS